MGDTYCADGQTLASCSSFGSHTLDWSKTSCDGACVTAEGRSFCSPWSEPQPQCQGVAPDDAIMCAQNTPSTCIGGYVAPGASCSGTCLAAPDGLPACAYCSYAPGPVAIDPVCAGLAGPGLLSQRQSSLVCEGDVLVTCNCGYGEKVDCAPRHCVLDDAGTPTCS